MPLSTNFTGSVMRSLKTKSRAVPRRDHSTRGYSPILPRRQLHCSAPQVRPPSRET
jgi:hypothetical protein